MYHCKYLICKGRDLWAVPIHAHESGEMADFSKSEYKLLEKQINYYAKKEVEDKFESMADLLWDDPDMDISGKKEEAQLGSPFIYYDANRKSNQIMDFYYPVMIKGNVVGIIEAISSNGNWTLSITNVDNDFKQLNEIDYNQEQPLFYVIGNEVFMETAKSCKEFTYLLDNTGETSLQKKFSLKSYEEKMEEIVQNTKSFNEDSQSAEITKTSQEEKKTTTKPNKDSTHDWTNPKWFYAGIATAILIVVVVPGILVYRRKR